VTFHSHGKLKNNGISTKKCVNEPWEPYVDRGNFIFFVVTLSLKCTVFEIFDFKNAVTLKTGLGLRQGHSKYHHVIENL